MCSERTPFHLPMLSWDNVDKTQYSLVQWNWFSDVTNACNSDASSDHRESIDHHAYVRSAQLLPGLETGVTVGQSLAYDFSVSDEQKAVFLDNLVSISDCSETDSYAGDWQTITGCPSLTQAIIVQMVYFTAPGCIDPFQVVGGNGVFYCTPMQTSNLACTAKEIGHIWKVAKVYHPTTCSMSAFDGIQISWPKVPTVKVVESCTQFVWTERSFIKFHSTAVRQGPWTSSQRQPGKSQCLQRCIHKSEHLNSPGRIFLLVQQQRNLYFQCRLSQLLKLKSVLKSLPSKISTGVDNISYRLLKRGWPRRSWSSYYFVQYFSAQETSARGMETCCGIAQYLKEGTGIDKKY